MNAFHSCLELRKVIIPESVEAIGIGAFYCCKKLEKVTIPESCERIGEVAFRNCENAKVIIRKPKSEFKEIGVDAFSFCKSVEYVKEKIRS